LYICVRYTLFCALNSVRAHGRMEDYLDMYIINYHILKKIDYKRPSVREYPKV